MTKNRIKYFKSLARKTLFDDWTSQVCAFLIVTVCFTGITYLGYAFADLLVSVGVTEDYIFIFPILYALLAMFVTVPIVLGVFYFECKIISGTSKGVSDVFFAFSPEHSLNRVYRVFISFMLKVLPGIIPGALVFYYTNNIYPNMLLKQVMLFEVDVMYLILNCVGLALLFFGFVAGAKHLVGLYYALKLENRDVGACFLMGRMASYKHSFEIFRFALSFFPIFIASLFTFGFLFVAYTLPIFFLSFAYMSEYLYTQKICGIETECAFEDMFECDIPQNNTDESNTQNQAVDQTNTEQNINLETQDNEDKLQ